MKTTLLTLLLGVNIALGQTNGYCNLVWADEFNGNTLSSDWNKEVTCYGGGNNELQCYTPRDKNVYLENGALVLKAYPETYTGSQDGCSDSQGCTWTKQYTSGRVNTAGHQTFLYGRFETRAKLPSGTHLWPAIWMLPEDWAYGGWAASGEIDIMESRGDHPDLISGTLHHGNVWPGNVWTTTGDHGLNGVDLSQDFHVYALEWTSTSIKWFLDGYNFQTIDTQRWWNTSAGVYQKQGQPWDRRFHFILNLAVGGGFFGGYPDLQIGQAYNWANPTMKIDYVRAYTLGGNCGATPTTANNNDGNNRPTSAAQTPATTSANNNNNNNNNNDQAGMCNGQGYNSATYTCTINEASQRVLCPTGNSACGQACYNPATYCCANGGLQPAGASSCPKAATTKATSAAATTKATSAAATTAAPTTKATSAAATTAATTKATSAAATTAAPTTKATSAAATTAAATTKATSAAGTTKTPATSSATPGLCNGQVYGSGYVCALNNLGQYQLCSSSTPAGCSGACYNPNNYCCKKGSLQPAGQC